MVAGQFWVPTWHSFDRCWVCTGQLLSSCYIVVGGGSSVGAGQLLGKCLAIAVWCWAVIG